LCSESVGDPLVRGVSLSVDAVDTLRSACVGDRREALMAGSSPARAPMTTAAPGRRPRPRAGCRKRYARSVNEEYVELIRARPGRFGAFAALPGDSPDAILEELTYALDTPCLDGVLLTSIVDGHSVCEFPFDTARNIVNGI
jgi:hypothetical protein